MDQRESAMGQGRRDDDAAGSSRAQRADCGPTAGHAPADEGVAAARPPSSQEARRRPRLGRRAALVGAGTVVACGVGIAGATGAFAADGSGSAPQPSPSASGTQQAPHRGPGARGPGPAAGVDALARALHGEAVVQKAGGGYETIAVQRGSVTAVSTSSITVKSTDGYSRTYTVTADTLVNAARDGIASVKSGDAVNVTAVVDGNTSTARSVGDATVRRAAPGGPSTPASPPATQSALRS